MQIVLPIVGILIAVGVALWIFLPRSTPESPTVSIENTTAVPETEPSSAHVEFEDYSVDETLYGYLLDGGGRVVQTCWLTVKGDVIIGDDWPQVWLDIEFLYPEKFRFPYAKTSNGYSKAHQESFNIAPYMTWSVPATLDRDNINTFAYTDYAWSQTQKYLFARYGAKDGDYYLVASRIPEADPQMLLDYFERFDKWIDMTG